MCTTQIKQEVSKHIKYYLIHYYYYGMFYSPSLVLLWNKINISLQFFSEIHMNGGDRQGKKKNKLNIINIFPLISALSRSLCLCLKAPLCRKSFRQFVQKSHFSLETWHTHKNKNKIKKSQNIEWLFVTAYPFLLLVRKVKTGWWHGSHPSCWRFSVLLEGPFENLMRKLQQDE